MFKKLRKVAGILVILCTLGAGFNASAQTRTISGKVLDTGGQPVIGAAVMEPGTTNGATTDLDGNFSLRVEPGATLEISCIGYTTIRVKAQEDLKITLEEDSEMLEETIVVGYGTQKKASLTSAISNIRNEELTATK